MKVGKLLLPLLVCGLAMALALAACGGSSGDSSQSAETNEAPAAATEEDAGTEPTSAGAKATGEPIVIGTVCDCTGVFASDQGAIPDTVKAWEESVNDEGGINGHPVEVKLADDEANPTKALGLVKKLVEQDHIVALVGTFSVVEGSFVEYLEQKEIPIIGGWGPEPIVTNSSLYYPSTANSGTMYYLTAEQAAEEGNKKMASMYCSEGPQCKKISQSIETWLGELGGEMVYSATTTATEPNFIAQCLAAKEAGANAIYFVSGAQVDTKVAEDCEQQGVEATLYSNSSSIGKEMLPLPIADGLNRTQPTAPPTADTPGGAKMIEVLEKYQPANLESEAFGSGDMYPWSGLSLFRVAAEKGQIAPGATLADLEKGLYMIKDETLEGIAPPLTFEKGKSKFVGCGFVEKIENEEYVVQNNAEPVCLSAQAVKSAKKVSGEE